MEERMQIGGGSDPDDPSPAALIGRSLRLIYDGAREQEPPDRFKALIDQLRSAGSGRRDGA